MTLTDREIAIFHLVLGWCDKAEDIAAERGRIAEQFDGYLAGFCESRFNPDCIHCQAVRALAMVPLYRHAFGIEAPGETQSTIARPVMHCNVVDVSAPVESVRFADALNAFVKSGAVKLDINGYMRETETEPSPASLAIANALSRTRP